MAALEKFPIRDKALVAFMLQTGYRVTEALSLSLGDIWANGRIRPRVTVNRARLKAGRSSRCRSITARSVVLNTRAVAVLEPLVFSRFGSGGPDDLGAPLFPGRYPGGHLSRWQANKVVHRVLEVAGIEASGGKGDYGTHSLRKTFCCNLFTASNFNIVLTSAGMGHAHLETTHKYLAINDVDIDRAILSLGQKQGPAPIEQACTATERIPV